MTNLGSGTCAKIESLSSATLPASPKKKIQPEKKPENRAVIMIAAAIFAARDLAKDWDESLSPRAIAAAANAIDKAKFLIEETDRRLC